MRHMIFVGALAAVLASAPAWAQANKEDKSTEAGAQKAPRPQPATAPTPTVPTGEMALGTFRIPKAVKADGKTLPAGTYATFAYPISGLQKGFGEIYNQLLPASNYVQEPGLFFERYDEKFDARDPNALVEICLPVRPK